MCTGCSPRLLSERAKCLQISVLCVRSPEDLRLVRPVILLRGLPATAGSLRRFQADSRAGSARDDKKPAVVMSNTYANLQDFYGSDGTRTRDLRRDRPLQGALDGWRPVRDRPARKRFEGCSARHLIAASVGRGRLLPICCPPGISRTRPTLSSPSARGVGLADRPLKLREGWPAPGAATSPLSSMIDSNSLSPSSRRRSR
jgi:hypothetical protein